MVPMELHVDSVPGFMVMAEVVGRANIYAHAIIKKSWPSAWRPGKLAGSALTMPLGAKRRMA